MVGITWISILTNITRQDQEVIIGETTVFGRVQKGLSVESISGVILVLEDFEGLCVVKDLVVANKGHGVATGVAVGDRHLVEDVCVEIEQADNRRMTANC